MPTHATMIGEETFTEEKWTRLRMAAVAKQLVERGITDERVL